MTILWNADESNIVPPAESLKLVQLVGVNLQACFNDSHFFCQLFQLLGFPFQFTDPLALEFNGGIDVGLEAVDTVAHCREWGPYLGERLPDKTPEFTAWSVGMTL